MPDRVGYCLWEAALGVLRYLLGTPNFGLTYGPSPKGQFYPGNMSLTAFSDADFAGSDKISFRSTTWFVLLVNGTVVAWQSRLQQTVARSTTEAEYQALSATIAITLWLRKVFSEILSYDRLLNSTPTAEFRLMATPISVDNQSTITLAEKPNSVKRCKHIDVMHGFIIDRATRGSPPAVSIQYVQSEKNVADIFTKPLPLETFAAHRSGMGMTVLQPAVQPSSSI